MKQELKQEMQKTLFKMKRHLEDNNTQEDFPTWSCPIINLVFTHCVECSGVYKTNRICDECIVKKSLNKHLNGETNEPEKS